MNAIDFDYPECGAKLGERCHAYIGKWEPAAHAKRKHIAFEEEMRRNTAEEEIEEHDDEQRRHTNGLGLRGFEAGCTHNYPLVARVVSSQVTIKPRIGRTAANSASAAGVKPNANRS